MKKYLFTLLAMAFISVAVINAQESSYKPEDGSFSLEVGFSPFNLGNDHSSFSLPSGKLTGIYSIKNGWGVRLGLGISANNVKYDNSEDAGADWEKFNVSQTVFSIAPGFSYSFAGTRRLTPYIGAELAIATASNKYTYETDGYKETVTNDIIIPDNIEELEQIAELIKDGTIQIPQTGIGMNAFAGFNYYFSKNIYVGAEVGVGFMSYRFKDITEEATGEGKITNSNPLKASDFKIYANPQIRLGWAF